MVTRKKQSEDFSVTSAPIRRRFAAWSLAVVGALSSSGMVCLQPSAVWGYDDSTTEKKEEKADDKKPGEAFNREVFSKLLATNKVDEAIEKLDMALAAAPEDSQLLSMELQAASYLARSNQEESSKRFSSVTAKLLGKPELDFASASVLMQAVMVRSQVDRNLPYEEKMELLDIVSKKLTNDLGEKAVGMTRSLTQLKARLQMGRGNG